MKIIFISNIVQVTIATFSYLMLYTIKTIIWQFLIEFRITFDYIQKSVIYLT